MSETTTKNKYMETSSIDKKELVWLPAELAKKVKDLEGVEATEKAILDYVAQTQRDIKINIESIDDDIVQYRAHMIKARQAFEKAKNEELDASYALWEKFEDDLKKVRDYVGRVKKEVQPIKDELESISVLMKQVATWDIEKLLKILETVRYDLTGDTGEMIKFLFNNYKRG